MRFRSASRPAVGWLDAILTEILPSQSLKMSAAPKSGKSDSSESLRERSKMKIMNNSQNE